MTLYTQMTLALLQELLMALRANDADGYKSWLAHGIDQRGRDVVDEVKSKWMMQCSSVREERETPRVNTMFQVCNVDDKGIHG